jgi:hypothetical protein
MVIMTLRAWLIWTAAMFVAVGRGGLRHATTSCPVGQRHSCRRGFAEHPAGPW